MRTVEIDAHVFISLVHIVAGYQRKCGALIRRGLGEKRRAFIAYALYHHQRSACWLRRTANLRHCPAALNARRATLATATACIDDKYARDDVGLHGIGENRCWLPLNRSAGIPLLAVVPKISAPMPTVCQFTSTDTLLHFGDATTTTTLLQFAAGFRSEGDDFVRGE